MAAPKTGRPTMIDVAADAGVSLKTVSRVVNEVPTVDPSLAARVRTSIAKLGFRRNEVAASLRAGGETRTIGLITADLSNTFYSTLSSEVARIARSHGFQVIIASSEEDPELEKATALDLCQRRVSGLIIIAASDDHTYLTPEIERGIPAVFIDRPAQGIEADSFLIDNFGGTADAVRQLIAKGHTRIGFVFDSPAIYTMRERKRGALHALAEAGITEDPLLMVIGSHAPVQAAEAVRAMVANPHPPTAIVCGNNRSLIGALVALAELPDSAGEAIDVIGFDDFEFSPLVPRPISLIAYDTGALGSLAATRLFELIHGEVSPTVHHFEKTTLIERGRR